MTESTRIRPLRRALPLIALATVLSGPTLAVAAPSSAPATTPTSTTSAIDLDNLPDPMDRGMYEPATIQETKLGLVDLQEPNSAGSAPTAGTAQAAEQMEIRGALYYPADRTEPSPVIVLVHGNHGSCDSGQNTSALNCAQFKRNEAGYAYLAENLATWGYTTFSVSQDQMMMRQDSAKGKGMHQRRLLIAASLDALSAANEPGGLPVDSSTTIGDTLAGKLDMTRIGLMGHSRGGDGVTSFIDYNRTRTDGPRYPLRGVISLAPVDYERKAPYGVPYMSILPWCDGDVSNLQGARFYERAQYINEDSPFPLIQSSQLGANHNWYNTVWYADGQDGGNVQDAACGNSLPSNSNNVQPNNLRLSGAAQPDSYVIDNSDTYNPEVNTKISGDPERMGDQEKIGLATMSAFFRRYVGGEGAFEPYMTGELSTTESHLQIPETACPTSESGTRIDCAEYVSTSYFPAKAERVDVIRPEVINPLTVNALGGTLSGDGFAYPYLDNGGVELPEATPGGYDWCNPEPDDFAPSQLGKSTQPTGAKPCPLPGKTELGGQNGIRENAPVNHSYGRQLALAWEEGQTATLTAQIPAASKDMSGLKALAMGADVNFFDSRNPGSQRYDEENNPLPVTYDPAATTQDFVIALTDTAGNEATVNAGDPRWGNALHMSTGTVTSRMHIVLDQIRVPLDEFASQGVDISSLAEVELRFGVEGTPASGSIQVADIRFQEAAAQEPLVLSDGVEPGAGAGWGAPTTGPDPIEFLDSIDATPSNVRLPDTTGGEFSNTTWVVDDDFQQCPDASFASIQDAIDYAAPWDTIVICEGVYEESSTPNYHASNPVATGAINALTITKPLKIKGVGADKVTIMPDQSLTSIAGVTPYLRDGGGNVITVSRQSLGSTDTNELFVEISGVTVTAGDTYAEAGIAYFGAAGRISESVIGPMKVATTASELADYPHGWGVVKTGLIRGAGPGTVENELTIADSEIKGYQSGGVLFDGARGTDGHSDNTVRTGIKEHGFVVRSVITGQPNSLFPQTGVQYASGADGFVTDSRITGNYFTADPAQSFGVLLTDAGIDTDTGLSVTGSILTANGFAVFNANADNTAVRTDAPVTVGQSYIGTGNPVQGGPANPTTGLEAISGSGSVVVQQRASSRPAAVPTKAKSVVNAAPKAAIIDPGPDAEVGIGQTIAPLVKASDDFAVKSVTLSVDGVSSAPATSAPYLFDWTASAAQAGKTVTIQATVTDALGRVTTSAPLSIKVASQPDPVGPPVPPTPTPPKPVTPPAVKPKGKAKVVVTKVKVRPKKGTVVLTVKPNAAGTIKVKAKKIKNRTVTVKSAKRTKIVIKPKKKFAKQLKNKAVKAKVKVVFTPRASAAKTGKANVTKSIRFAKRK
ncbi:hypothetical protein SAMN06309944_1705 [Micrococcales bacterium KH10]|nr:hypothetical protein SAMN06309944_1705 [Micrococcales bacterium KH10]